MTMSAVEVVTMQQSSGFENIITKTGAFAINLSLVGEPTTYASISRWKGVCEFLSFKTGSCRDHCSLINCIHFPQSSHLYEYSLYYETLSISIIILYYIIILLQYREIIRYTNKIVIRSIKIAMTLHRS